MFAYDLVSYTTTADPWYADAVAGYVTCGKDVVFVD